MPKTRNSKRGQENSSFSADLSDHPYLATKEAKLDDEEYNALPTSVKYRVQALRKLQLSEIENKIQFERELLHLENKYHQNTSVLNEKRSRIINGTYEPSKDELLHPVEGTCADYTPSKLVSGIPDFWLNILKKNTLSECWLEETDHALLRFLKDIKLTYHNSQNPDQTIDYDQLEKEWQASAAAGDKAKSSSKYSSLPVIDMFQITFEFGQNCWFTNKKLTKTYYLAPRPADSSNPLEFKTADIFKSKGCTIEWKSNDANLCQTIKTKKQKNKKSGQTRVVPSVEKRDSFFNFFAPEEKQMVSEEVFRKANEDKTDLDLEEEIEAIQIDFDLGNEFKDVIVPSAVLLFTNEYVDEDDDDDDDEDDDTSDDSSGSSDSDDGSDDSGDGNDESDSGNNGNSGSDSGEDSDDSAADQVRPQQCQQQ